MTLEEMIGWAAYHKMKNEEQEREMNKVRSKKVFYIKNGRIKYNFV